MMRLVVNLVAAIAMTAAISVNPAGADQTSWRWVPVRVHAAFPARDTGQSFYFRGQFWLSGGYWDGETAYRDLWRSKTGRKWTRVRARVPYEAYAGTAVLRRHIYAVRKEVWRSRDGKNWRKISSSSPLGDDSAVPTLRAFLGKLWLFERGHLWSSPNGKKWTPHQTPFEPRLGYEVITFDGSLWVIGGGKYEASTPSAGYPNMTGTSDVWRSDDGVHWRKMPPAPFSPRMWPSAVRYGRHIVVFGGYSNETQANLADAWRTRDGIHWEQMEVDERAPAPTARHWSTLYSSRRGILVVAGNSWPPLNDVWLLRESPVSAEAHSDYELSQAELQGSGKPH